ncbi:MAG: multidrug effflux MFS transporter [Paracoccaceae bacterium]
MEERRPVRFFDRTTPPHIVTLVLVTGLSAMNMSVFLPSLPAMTVYFDTSYQVIQLSVSLYLACVAVAQLFIGPISDKYGRRSVLLWSMGIFLCATLGCIFAPSVEVFLAFRMLQCVIAAGIVLGRAVVRDMVPQDEAASMIGYVTMGMALVPMVAPMIGGALDQAFGWHATFWALFVGGAAVMFLTWGDLGETVRGQGRSFGEQLKDYPELMRSRRFWGYVMASALASAAFFAFLGGAPYVASEIYQLSSFWAGVCFGAPAVGYATGNFISGRYSVRVGINKMIIIGAIIGATGLTTATILIALGFDKAPVFFGFCTFVGLGNGMVIPNASAGMLSVRPHLAGTASGVGASIMIGGGAILSVFAGWALTFGGGSLPLILIMTVSMYLTILTMVYVIKRERAVIAES